jgi:hypothetical protein
MKKLAGIILICIMAHLASAAIISSNLFPATVISNAVITGPVVKLGVVTFPQTTFAIQNQGAVSNAFIGGVFYASFSTNISSGTTIGSYTPSLGTNANVDSVVLTNGGVIPIYFWFTAGGTNSVPVLVSAQFIQQK